MNIPEKTRLACELTAEIAPIDKTFTFEATYSSELPAFRVTFLCIERSMY